MRRYLCRRPGRPDGRQAALNNYEALRLQVILPQDGYVTAYVGNESDTDVSFEDLQIVKCIPPRRLTA